MRPFYETPDRNIHEPTGTGHAGDVACLRRYLRKAGVTSIEARPPARHKLK